MAYQMESLWKHAMENIEKWFGWGTVQLKVHFLKEELMQLYGKLTRLMKEQRWKFLVKSIRLRPKLHSLNFLIIGLIPK
jgi:hypothetical protein